MRLKLLALVLAVAAPFAISDGNSPAEAVPGQTARVSVPNLADQGTLGTEANSYSGLPDISADGRFVAFESNASNLVVGDGNGFDDIFVHDRVTGATDRVNVSTGGAEANGGTIGARISGDGRYVAFTSEATNLVTTRARADVFVRDRQTGVTERVSVDSAGGEGNESSILTDMTPDGRFIVFSSWASNLVPGDTHVCQEYFEFEIIYYNCSDVFIKDRLTSVTERVSVNSAGQQGTDGSSGGSVSDDARFIVFYGGTGIGPGGAAGTVIRDQVLGDDGHGSAEVTVMSGDGGSVVFIRRRRSCRTYNVCTCLL
jgi:Tol biopolymer transport system component